MIVVDASVLAPAIADIGTQGQRFRERLRGQALAGPDLLRVEVASVLRRQLHRGLLTLSQAEAAMDDLLNFPIRVFPTTLLLRRVWDLKANLTSYDACYVALAEAIDGVLVTADKRLAQSPGPQCQMETL